MPAHRESRVDPELQALEPRLLRGRREAADDGTVALDVAQRGTVPEVQRGGQLGVGLGVAAVPVQGSAGGEAALEPGDVAFLVDVQQVARSTRDQRARAVVVAAQQLPQLRDVHVQGGVGATRRVLAPELGDELVEADHVARPD